MKCKLRESHSERLRTSSVVLTAGLGGLGGSGEEL
jgi:hypothetical protein